MSELSRREFLGYVSAGLLAFEVTAEAQNIRNLPPSTPEQQKEALEYMGKTVNPVLSRHALDEKEIPAIKNRLLALSRLTMEKKLKYEAVAVNNPFDESAIAKVDYDQETKVNRLIAFVPQIKADQLKFNWSANPKDFEDYLVLTFAHEVIHLELLAKDHAADEQNKHGWPNKKLMQQDEAEAWGVSILEIVRPMLKAKRYVPKAMADASDLLKQCKDNYKDPKWVETFAGYHSNHKRF